MPYIILAQSYYFLVVFLSFPDMLIGVLAPCMLVPAAGKHKSTSGKGIYSAGKHKSTPRTGVYSAGKRYITYGRIFMPYF